VFESALPASQQVHFEPAVSKLNGLPRKKLCHYLNQSRIMSGILVWAAH